MAVDTGTDIFPIYLDDVGLKAKCMTHLLDLDSILLHMYDGDECRFIRDCIMYFKRQFNLEPRV